MDSVADRSVAARFRARVVNPVLRLLLQSPAHRMLSGSVLLLDYTGRRSGRRYGLPVMYASTGDGFVVMAGQPAHKTWWRNFGGEPQPVAATVGGKRTMCTARLLDVGADEHRQAVQAYQRRFPKMVLDPTAPVLLITDPGSGPVDRDRTVAMTTDHVRDAAAVAVPPSSPPPGSGGLKTGPQDVAGTAGPGGRDLDAGGRGRDQPIGQKVSGGMPGTPPGSVRPSSETTALGRGECPGGEFRPAPQR
jgi:deazaflavin-dependent oxidoreductase (nitroreductase family)